jgi:hypothetical protein
MEILVEARTEDEVLVSVRKEATPEVISQALADAAESCVDSRCGCGAMTR